MYRSALQHLQAKKAWDQDEQQEKQKGRKESRHTAVYKFELPTALAKQWPRIVSLIVVKRKRETHKEVSCQTHFYLTNMEPEYKASGFAKAIRQHWSIENGLHWVKDVILHEDASLIKQWQAARNMAVLRSILINAFREHGHDSITVAIIAFANKIDKLFHMLMNKRT